MLIMFWIAACVVLILEGYQPLTTFWKEGLPVSMNRGVALLKAAPFAVGSVLAMVMFWPSSNLALALLGVVLLIRAADVLITGAEVVAAKAKIPPVVIGILVIGLGTSSPEFFVNTISALQGNTDIAFGNIVGSNICNMGLVIGIAGWMAGRISIQRSIITAEIPVMLAATVLVIFQVLDFPPFSQPEAPSMLSVQDGMVMLLGVCMYLLYTFHTIANVPQPENVTDQYQSRYGDADGMRTWAKPIGQILIGVAGLYLGGQFTVSGATNIAVGLGAGTLVVGVIIGVGTSLPELATAISSVLKNKPDLVIGNVVGSNIFNLLLILGATAMIEPIVLDQAIFWHLGFLLLTTCLFFIALGTKKELSRAEAIFLTFLGIAYLAYSIITGGA